jgi:hypothetical protein
LLAVPACTENDLDEGDQDVVLEITSFNTPPVTGEIELGFCQLTPAIDCLNNNNCPIGDICVLPPGGGECLITPWTLGLTNMPLSEGAGESPFNDVLVHSVDITYDWSPLAIPTFTRTIGLGGVAIPAAGSGTVTFFPITFNDIAADDTGVDLIMRFNASTVAGIGVNMPPATVLLLIDDCIP